MKGPYAFFQISAISVKIRESLVKSHDNKCYRQAALICFYADSMATLRIQTQSFTETAECLVEGETD